MRLGSFWSASFRISSSCASRPYAMYTSASAIGSTSSASIPEVWLTDACETEPGERESPSEGPLPPPVPSTLSEKLAWLDFFRRPAVPVGVCEKIVGLVFFSPPPRPQGVPEEQHYDSAETRKRNLVVEEF